MAGLTSTEHTALKLFKLKLAEAFPDRKAHIQLFGSKARGDAQKHSDVDVLVTLPGATWSDRHQVSAATSHVILATGVVISPKTFSPEQLEEMKRRRSMFWQTIEPDLQPV